MINEKLANCDLHQKYLLDPECTIQNCGSDDNCNEDFGIEFLTVCGEDLDCEECFSRALAIFLICSAKICCMLAIFLCYWLDWTCNCPCDEPNEKSDELRDEVKDEEAGTAISAAY